MTSDSNNSMGKIISSLIIGISLIIAIFILREPLFRKDQFEFKQEGPVFVRFNQHTGELCYTGIAPNGKFVSDAWLCLDGKNTKKGEVLEAKEMNQPPVGESTAPGEAPKSNKKK